MHVVTELCVKRGKGNYCILVTALSDRNVRFIYNKLVTNLSGVRLIPLVQGTVDFVREALSDTILPRVVIATAVGFTGMTFVNCDVVISSGLTRLPVMNTITGLLELVNVIATKEDFEQSSGRAGRDTDKGVVFSLQSSDFRQQYSKVFDDVVFPDPSFWIMHKLKDVSNTHYISEDDSPGLVTTKV